MRQVTQYPLWIGHRGDLRDWKAINAAGITLLVDLAIDEPVPQISRELAFARFPLRDGAGNDSWLIRAAIDLCVVALRHDETVMVRCSSGMSRSPSIAAAALSVYTGRLPSECLTQVISGGGDVSPSLWAKVLDVLAHKGEPLAD